MAPEILLYTDGAARGNPGPGGYGVLLMYGNNKKELSGAYQLTTNNRMEIMAVIEGLKAIKNNNIPVHIFSDSQYVVKALTEGWLNTWIKTNFKGDKKNPDLWRQVHALLQNFTFKATWVKGHASNPYNNRCDVLATTAADNPNIYLIDTWYENNQAKK
jgi:ribonuclease HI